MKTYMIKNNEVLYTGSGLGGGGGGGGGYSFCEMKGRIVY